MKAEIDLGFKEAKQPTFQFFVTALYASGLESGADDIVGLVIHSPDQIGVHLAQKRRRIGQGGEVFAKLLRIGIIVLEFHPFCFLGQFAQLMDKTGKIFRGTADAHSPSSISA